VFMSGLPSTVYRQIIENQRLRACTICVAVQRIL
jgi:hypothetical protein